MTLPPAPALKECLQPAGLQSAILHPSSLQPASLQPTAVPHTYCDDLQVGTDDLMREVAVWLGGQ